NDPRERRVLWADLKLHKRVVSGLPLVLLGDFNVALNMKDICIGSSSMNSAMCDFKDYVRSIEVMDIHSTGLHFTWNQKPRRRNGILKKLDRIMGNLDFVDTYQGRFLELLNTHWNASIVGHSMFQDLDEVQKALDRNPSNSDIRGEEAVYVQAFDEAKIDEERFLRQKAKIDWLEGAMFDIGEDKASGPDVYTLMFLKKGRDVVGADVCKAIHDLFSNGKLLNEINHTFMTLIPKIATPQKVNDYRPISCCNVIYKCISKIITNRIKEVVSENQSAFVLGRRFSDNILLTQELMHNYHLKRGSPRCAFKVDIQKAYDTVDWRFLELSFKCFGFHSTMIK
ncbi:putative RNA-directed DNA polymerase, eukaryota, reverse transcriptase zinc-binding domain protein, partial [Tanacetum coccineum]